MTDEQKAALDLAVLNLKTHGDDQLLSAVQPLIEFYESRVLAERDQEPTLTDADWIRDAVFQAGITSDVWYRIKDAIDAAKGASK